MCVLYGIPNRDTNDRQTADIVKHETIFIFVEGPRQDVLIKYCETVPLPGHGKIGCIKR